MLYVTCYMLHVTCYIASVLSMLRAYVTCFIASRPIFITSKRAYDFYPKIIILLLHIVGMTQTKFKAGTPKLPRELSSLATWLLAR